MKKTVNFHLILLLWLCLFSNYCKGQVTINQVTLKLDSNGWDTATVRFTSNYGNVDFISSSTFPGQGSSCLNEWVWLVFKGPLDSTSTTIDTSLRIGSFGFLTKYFRLQADLDTSSSPLPPSPRIVMDSYLYDTCTPTGLHENSTLDFKVYPNPTSDLLNIQAPVNQYNWQMIDALGKTVLDGSVTQNVKLHQISMAELPKGIYFLRLAVAEQVLIKKVVKH